MSMKEFKINTLSITERDTEALSRYLRDVNRMEQISPEEEARLAHVIKKGGREGEKAKETLIKANLRFVISVANQYKRYGMDLSDIISEGNIGLVKAASLFDDTCGFKFITYAVWWIRQSILSAIASNGNIIRMPQNKLNILTQYRRMQKEVMQSDQRPLTINEFADIIGLDAATISDIISAAGKTASMDAPIADDNDATLADTISSSIPTDDALMQESLSKDLNAILCNTLNARELQVIRMYYGLGCEEKSIDDIAFIIGKSRERTRQICMKAVDKLRHSPSSNHLALYLAA